MWSDMTCPVTLNLPTEVSAIWYRINQKPSWAQINHQIVLTATSPAANHKSEISSWVTFVYKNTNRICHVCSEAAPCSGSVKLPPSAGTAVLFTIKIKSKKKKSERMRHGGIVAVFPRTVWEVTGTTSSTLFSPSSLLSLGKIKNGWFRLLECKYNLRLIVKWREKDVLYFCFILNNTLFTAKNSLFIRVPT